MISDLSGLYVISFCINRYKLFNNKSQSLSCSWRSALTNKILSFNSLLARDAFSRHFIKVPKQPGVHLCILMQNKHNVYSTRTERYLWTSRLSLQLYIYTTDRYVESYGHYRHVFHDWLSHVVNQQLTHYTLQQLTTSGSPQK